MVWGMALPSGYGEFWPSGHFEYDPIMRETGWFRRLTVYYEEQTPEEQKRLFDFRGNPLAAARRYGTFPSYKFKAEPRSIDKNGLDPAYGPVEPHEVPRSWDMTKSHKTLGALIKTSSKILAVDGQLKSVIERLEPSVHEFHPLEMRMPKGQIYPGQYYVLRVGQYFDAFSRDDSWEGSVRDPERLAGEKPITSWLHLNDSKKGVAGLAFRKAIFGGAHLWRDRIFSEELTCFSDVLIAEIEQAGLRIPKHYRMREV